MQHINYTKGSVVLAFTNLDLKSEYRSFQDSITEDFYNPVLSESIVYKRAVGYFSSSALIEILKGIKALVENKGTVKLIASPQLSATDIEAIQKGYKSRDAAIEAAVVKSIDFTTDIIEEKKKLNILSYLIAEGILDIKLAFIDMDNHIGIYHEKLGIMEDLEGNSLVFVGSINETGMAFNYNYESFDVFCSWTNDSKRVESKLKVFDDLWNDRIKQVTVTEFPDVALEKFKEYIFEDPDWDVLKADNDLDEINPTMKVNEPSIPKTVKIRDYQDEAIKNWKDNEYQGIFDMATGTGKTYTGLAAAVKLYEDKRHLAIVIVCPYQHLVEQWSEDIELFGMKPIIGYSSSKQRNWKKALQDDIEFYNYNIKDHFCFVTTNATFSSKFVQGQLKSIEGEFLLLVDEAHNFGAEHLQTKLLKNAKYRLALSATIKRHNDEEGTNVLFSYFGKICMSYSLEKAILNDKLTPYYYYPVPVYLTEVEMEEYKKITREIVNSIVKDKQGNVKFTESAKFLLIKRARLIAGASNKIEALRIAIKEYENQSHMLVYCGATTINDPGYKEEEVSNEEIRQIDAVTNLLGNEMNMKVSKFTSEESAEDREKIKRTFAQGDNLQALIAIRCLDEGVDIPSIKTAFILASSTNPKEYIQRRGRVLRLYEGKRHANIYDFITLPMPNDELYGSEKNDVVSFKGLVKREVNRMEDFAGIAENSSVANELIDELKEKYYLYELINDGELI